jgi:homoserine dehydrogenase
LRIILCGFGVVGQSLVKLFDSRTEDLYAKYGLKPRVVGVFDSKGSAVDKSGLELEKLIEVKKKTGTVKNYANTKNNMSGIDMIKNTDADVVIETTASNYKDAEPGMAHHQPQPFQDPGNAPPGRDRSHGGV